MAEEEESKDRAISQAEETVSWILFIAGAFILRQINRARLSLRRTREQNENLCKEANSWMEHIAPLDNPTLIPHFQTDEKGTILESETMYYPRVFPFEN